MIRAADILGARILIVDDSAVNVTLLEQILRGAGYTDVSSTTDPRIVCQLHLEQRFDLILLDLLMPAMDGFAVMAALEAIETEGYLPVLVLTAQPMHKLRALKAGAKDFVSKPFEQIEVLTRIHNMLEVRLLLRESRQYGRLLEQYDQLTGLPNRRRFRDLLVATLSRQKGMSGTVSVLFLSVDRFTAVNDALGRVIGDALLRLVAARLSACIGSLDILARLEGREFGLVMTTSSDDGAVARLVAKSVQDAFHAPLTWEGFAVYVTISLGIAVAPTDANEADSLMKFAQTALHAAQSDGPDTFRFYSPEMQARAVEVFDLENALRDALEQDEFIIHYQPKMQIASGAWTGVEALLRWNRPGTGLVPPGRFIPSLESTGLILQGGAWVIERVCRQISEWAANGTGALRVAVNVSSRQFTAPGFVDLVARALRTSGILPESLEIEITESCLMAGTRESDQILCDLKALGVRISIDDFGTGYSSLAYLRRFPVDTLKIDISFIQDVPASADGAAIAVAIINLARSLRLTVVAEGVETPSQLAFLQEHDCDEIQGYLCSGPVTAAELARLHAAQHASLLSE